jgi:hypothetical protein
MPSKPTTPTGHAALLALLEARFARHPQRHAGIAWAAVLQRLRQAPAALDTLARMEATGGEPDVIGHDASTGEILFADCAAESPSGRRSLCYDDEALAARKKQPPAGSARGMARALGAELLDEAQYRALQTLGPFDTKTSSWLLTPEPVRERGGALFGDWRYGRVFAYHNGADAYFGARGFRALLRV